jgi:hypothetical protein
MGSGPIMSAAPDLAKMGRREYLTIENEDWLL